jgi:hypothetical protein
MTPLRDPFQVAGFTVEPARNVIAGPDGEIATEPFIPAEAAAGVPGHRAGRPCRLRLSPAVR